MDNNFKNKTNIIVFILAVLIISIANTFSPKTQTVSKTENRNLAAKSPLTIESLYSGEYIRNYESYFSDHFIMRDFLVVTSKKITSLNGITRDQEVALVDFDGQNVGGGGDSDSDETTTENNTQPSTKGNLLILDDTVMELYKFNEASSKSYADMLNTASDKMGSDVKVYSLIAPIQIEFLTEKKYKDLSDSQIDGLNFIKNNLTEKVTAVDAYTPLKEHINEYVYFRTDHHWTGLGAYYGYTGFAKAAGLTPLPLDNFKSGEAPGYLGYLSTVNPSEKINSNPDNVIYYNPPVKSEMQVYFYDTDTGEKKSYAGAVINKTYIDTDQKYGIFLGGDFPLGIIKTDAPTNKKIMVIKDSYANAFIPFLLPHYSEIYVVDPRHYKENILTLVKENNIHEVLFLNYILTTTFESYIDNVLSLMEN
ncbi:MAG: DHHW family protein [Sedimentibacter sp.]